MQVLIFSRGYLPGFKHGGPVRSLAGIVDALGDQLSFSIVASVFDSGEDAPYPGIEPDKWTRLGNADVLYKQVWKLPPRYLRKLVHTVRPDLIYLNSLFAYSTLAVLAWRKSGFLPRVPVVLAPRGELGPGALAIKGRKKQWFLQVAHWLRLYRGLTWQATTELEAEDIRRVFPYAREIVVAPNLPSIGLQPARSRTKLAGEARFVFVARIVEKKNLLFAIRSLRKVRGDVSLDVVGPLEDTKYWATCLAEASQLPPNVRFRYGGEVPHDEVIEALVDYDFMLLPTYNENFGHSIAEALLLGVPVLISDQTPWQDLEREQAGWDLALGDDQAWCDAVDRCIAMSHEKWQSMSDNARKFAKRKIGERGGKQAILDMFQTAAKKQSMR